MATLLPNAKQAFYDLDGNPLSGGSVAFYVPGTSTLKDTYQDAGATTLNTNPVVLDAAGEARSRHGHLSPGGQGRPREHRLGSEHGRHRGHVDIMGRHVDRHGKPPSCQRA